MAAFMTATNQRIDDMQMALTTLFKKCLAEWRTAHETEIIDMWRLTSELRQCINFLSAEVEAFKTGCHADTQHSQERGSRKRMRTWNLVAAGN